MLEHKTNQPINTKAIIFGMVLLFIGFQIGFHPTYTQYFPEFKKFTWLHHIHGALMASWVFLLVIQPILIHKKKFKAHRFVGKLSYITAPLMTLSMFLILKFSYHKYIANSTIEKEVANQASTIMQLFSFPILYTLAIFYRKQAFYHIRFMIGTGLLMITATFSRVFYYYFAAEIKYEMYISIGIAAILLLYDIRKKKDWKPYTIITAVLILFVSMYHARNKVVWQTFGRFWVNTFY